MGFACTEVDEPYDGMLHLCRRPLFYSALILSLNSLYREELQMIGSIKRRFSHIEVWLSDTDGRQAALAEAMRQGADGLIDAQGLHRVGAATPEAPATILPIAPAAPHTPPAPRNAEPQRNAEAQQDAQARRESQNFREPRPPEHVAARAEVPLEGQQSADPLLTAEELRALLQENPIPEVP
jgi:hypothetical protein